jgi:hypothetical protein
MPPKFTEHHAIVLDAMGVIFDAADDAFTWFDAITTDSSP